MLPTQPLRALGWDPRVNILAPSWIPRPSASAELQAIPPSSTNPPTHAIILSTWSGWPTDQDHDAPVTTDPTTIPPSPSRWSRQTQDTLLAAAAAWLHAHPDARLLVRNHHRHALHDHHTLIRFAVRWQDQPAPIRDRLGILIDPCAWITAQMLPDQEDHFQRIADAAVRDELAPLLRPGRGGLILTSLRHPADADPLSHERLGIDIGPPLQSTTLDDPRGVVNLALLRRAFAPIAPALAPVTLLSNTPAEQAVLADWHA
jgi:hypothetical protein